jgi:Winged helix-turn-helix DNA-binding
MSTATEQRKSENGRILLGILESIERDGGQSQRCRAAELGIALGLVNAYLKRCVKKGLLKVAEAPARRYAYYMTPQGFAEKSRLTLEYLSHSFNFFRRAKADCARLFEAAQARGHTRIALGGLSDLAEIATICAFDRGIRIVALIDPASTQITFIGYPVVASFEELRDEVDAVVITSLAAAPEMLTAAQAVFGEDRVLVPALLGLRVPAELDGERP